MVLFHSLVGALALAPLVAATPSDLAAAASAPILLQGAGGTVEGTFGTIQEAIDMAVSGDTVLIPPGVYTGAGNRNVRVSGKNITIRGAGQGQTIVDAEGATRGFTFTGQAVGAATLLADLTIRNGDGFFGGGIMVDMRAKPSFENLEVTGCTAAAGAGIYLAPDSAWNATGLYLHDNFADSGGGGISTAKSGGLIAASRIEDNFSGTAGGGMSISNLPAADGVSSLRIEDVLFLGNESFGDGGALYSEMTDLLFVDRCAFRDNTAGGAGGAIKIFGDLIHPPAADVVFLQNSLVAGNSAVNGGGIQILLGSLITQNCTIADNTATGLGGGLHADSDGLLLINSIFWGNTSPNPSVLIQQVDAMAMASLFFLFANDVEGGVPDPTSISADPKFVSPATGDYRLGVGSPCTNAGIGLGLLAGQTDLDGKPRVLSNAVDIGAYERVADVRPALSLGVVR